MSVERTIQRLLTVFGEPKTDNPDLYLEEFAKAIEGFSDAVLTAACDAVIRECVFFPRPAEVRERAHKVAARLSGSRVPDKFLPDADIQKDEASKQRVRDMLAASRQAVAALSLTAAIDQPRRKTGKELAAGEGGEE